MRRTRGRARRPTRLWTPLRVAVLYAAAGALWILLSDYLLGVFVSDPSAWLRFETLKGWLFILVTAVVLYVILGARERARRRSELRRQRSTDLFRLVVDAVEDYAIFMLDPEGRVVTWNVGAERVKGYPRSEILGRHFSCFYTEEDRLAGKPRENLRRAAQRGRVEDEGWRVRKDGSRFFADVILTALRDPEGRLRGFAKVTRDVTERREAEEELRQYSRGLETLHEIDRAILAGDSPHEIAHAALSRIRRLVGCERASLGVFEDDEVLLLAVDGEGPLDLRAGVRLERAAVGPAVDLSAGNDRVVSDLSLGAARGVERQLAAAGFRVALNLPLVARGQVIGLVNLASTRPAAFTEEQVQIAREVAADLAVAVQHARLREELRGHSEELEELVAERTARLEEINEELESFTDTVSHDLRAPLRQIKGLTEGLLEDFGESMPARAREYAGRVGDSARRMDQLIQDLLAYSRLAREEFRLESLDLRVVADSVLAQLRPEHRPAEVRIEGELGTVLADGTVLGQVLTNLVSNAVKFVAPGVRPAVRIRGERAGERQRLWVEDNGIGIAREDQERIFRTFERLHGIETYPGTGVGLGIVKKGVERMGGLVGVESEPGRGSRFWIELRAVPAVAPATGAAVQG